MRPDRGHAESHQEPNSRPPVKNPDTGVRQFVPEAVPTVARFTSAGGSAGTPVVSGSRASGPRYTGCLVGTTMRRGRSGYSRFDAAGQAAVAVKRLPFAVRVSGRPKAFDSVSEVSASPIGPAAITPPADRISACVKPGGISST